MRMGDIIFSMFILILIYLLVANARGADLLVKSSFSGVSGLTKTLQGRG